MLELSGGVAVRLERIVRPTLEGHPIAALLIAADPAMPVSLKENRAAVATEAATDERIVQGGEVPGDIKRNGG